MRQLIYYSQNPKMDLQTVTTISGETEYRINCRKITDKFYVMNKDCFMVGGKWIRVDSGLIEKDWETGEWVKTNSPQYIKMVEGIVNFVDGKPVLGMFTPNKLNNCYCVIDSIRKRTVLNPDLLYDNNFIEDVSKGIFYPKKDLNENGLRRIQTPTNGLDHTRKGYNIEDNHVEFEEKKRIFEDLKLSMSKDVRVFARFLGDTTFGLEIETSKGYVPDHLQYRSGVVVCRDGSLRDVITGLQGAEFVTIPYKGAKGVQAVINFCTEAKKRTETDLNCSVHIHLGNFPTDRTSLTSIYMLCHKIQNEIFEMLPYYKTDPSGIKGKNYNQKLKKLGMYALNEFTPEGYNEFIKNSYERLYTFLSEGINPNESFNRKNKRHPNGDARNKWSLHSRYFWANFMNVIFSERGTIEFRPHENSLNEVKIINWLYICNAIIKYAIRHPREILTTGKKFTLNMILDYYKDSFKTPKAELLSDYLKAYVNYRKEVFRNDLEKGDRVSNHWTEKDKEFTFEFEGIKSLF